MLHPFAKNLPSLNRKRLMQMQQLERNADFDQAQECSGDLHCVDSDHLSLQEVAADYQYPQARLINRRLLHAKYGLATRNQAAYNDDHYERRADEDRQNVAADHHLHYADHIEQQESVAADQYVGKRDSENVAALRPKYGYSNQGFTSHSDHHLDRYAEHNRDNHHSIEEEIVAAARGSRVVPASVKTNRSHRAHNSQPPQMYDKLHAEHSTANHQSMPRDFKANHKGSGITSSTLQAAQAQAAELRALHSALLNNHGFADQNAAAYDHYHQKQKQEDAFFHKARQKKASSKKGKGFSDDEEDVHAQNPLSSASSISSIADCFIRPPHEYPIFIPSHEDMNSVDRRSSVDNREAALREERLNYIFDHENKRSFSGMQYRDLSKRDLHNVSCLHESLNLPPRSSSSLSHVRDKDDHPLHLHKSLNLPPGSQHHLVTENPLFDSLTPSDNKASYRPVTSLDGSSYSLAKSGDLHNAALSKSMDQYAYEFSKPTFTGRQRALLEFLSEEPARMRTFNELAATPDIAQVKAQIQSTQNTRISDAPSIANPENHLSASKRTKNKYESTQHDDQLQVSSSNHHARHQSMPRHPSMGHPDRPDHSMNTPGVSFDKCRPIAGAHTVVVPLMNSGDLDTDHTPARIAHTVAKEKSDQKKPSFKGWFFRGKKKHTNVDLSNNQTKVEASPISACKDRISITSTASSGPAAPEKQGIASLTAKEKQNSASSTSTATAATSSNVFPSLINSEAEKDLEVAMAMDLMELKVLQANTKRDAAMAEVLELRLAMDSMAKKLVEVERSCEVLRTQLIDVQALQNQADDQILADHQHNAPAPDLISTADLSNVSTDNLAANELLAFNAEETDQYESDSVDHREERRPSKGISMIRTGLTSSYGGRNNIRYVQPTKADFLNAVADARVGIRQVSRVLLQHIQETKGTGGLVQAEADHLKGGWGVEEAEGAEGTAAGEPGKKEREREKWGPILIMCREAARTDQEAGMSGGNRGRGVAYCVEAVISMAFHEHFENVGFDKNGAHKILDPAQRALAFYHSFLKQAKLTPTQLLSQPSPLYNSAFDNFCSRKMRALGRAVGCPGRLWPDELARTFLFAARAVWLLHHLAFAYHDCPPGIFRVAAESSFDSRFMEVLPSDSRHVAPSSHLFVSLMVMPGFFLPDDIIKCKVLAS